MIDAFKSLPNGKLRLTIAILLTINAMFYALIDSFINTLDAFAWLGFLLSCELETATYVSPFREETLQKIRNGLIILIVLLTFAYLFTGDLLGLLDSILWLGLVALLEFEIRAPQMMLENKKKYWLASLGVFSGLLIMLGIYAWNGSFLDAYNQFLWIFAFTLVEVDIFKFLRLKF
jgi:hypothetical protein